MRFPSRFLMGKARGCATFSKYHAPTVSATASSLAPYFGNTPPVLPSGFTRHLTICNPVKGPLQPDVAPLGKGQPRPARTQTSLT
jgi:hypothetical protein